MSLFFSVKSNYNFVKTTELIKKSIILSIFSVLAELNLADKLRLNNLPYEGDLLVLELCNPTYAYSALNSNEDSKYLLPCRITISGESKITVGMIDYENFKSLGYDLSDSELFFLNEIKQVISIVKETKSS